MIGRPRKSSLIDSIQRHDIVRLNSSWNDDRVASQHSQLIFQQLFKNESPPSTKTTTKATIKKELEQWQVGKNDPTIIITTTFTFTPTRVPQIHEYLFHKYKIYTDHKL